MPDLSSLLFLASYLLMFLGIVGALVPVLPGPILIWLGALLWAWGDDFVHVGWPTLLVLAVLTIIAWAVDLGLGIVSSRRSGAGWRSLFVSMLGGLGGAILLSGVPVLGTFIGAVAGSISALWFMEYRRARASATVAAGAGGDVEKTDEDHRAAATKAVKGYVSGFAAAMAVQLVICVMMLAIFAWQAFV